MLDLLALLLTLYLYGFVIRFLLAFHEADFYNPISQSLARATDPPYQWLRRMLPTVRGLDLSLLVIALALQLIVLYVEGLPLAGASLFGILIFALAGITGMALNVYLVSLIVVVIASWVQLSEGAHTFLNLVRSITTPMLMRIRGVLPDTGMFDLSPMVALLGLYFAKGGVYRIGIWGLTF